MYYSECNSILECSPVWHCKWMKDTINININEKKKKGYRWFIHFGEGKDGKHQNEHLNDNGDSIAYHWYSLMMYV